MGDLLWPRDLTLFYAHPRVAHWGLALAALVAIIAARGRPRRQRRRRPYILIGLLLFLGVLVPSLGFVQIGEQARADRFVYLAEIGLFIAIVWTLDALLPASRRLRWLAALLPLGALGVATMKQVEHWETDLDLFEHTIAVAPMDAAMMALWLNALDRPDERQEAIKLLETKPPRLGYQAGHWDLAGRLRLSIGDPLGAAQDFRKAIELEPNDNVLHGNLATALATTGDTAGAESEFRRAIAGGVGTYSIHNNYATMLERLGRKEEAREQYERALRFMLTEEGVALTMRKIDERLKR
jgi:tetratricopeptide (TPR) repeat protein